MLFADARRVRSSNRGTGSTDVRRMTVHPGEMALHAYLDDALEPAGRARVCAHLLIHAGDARRLAAYFRQKMVLRRLLGGFPAKPGPEIVRSSRRLARVASSGGAPNVEIAIRKPSSE
jgi:anti-sigma factor RsiW